MLWKSTSCALLLAISFNTSYAQEKTKQESAAKAAKHVDSHGTPATSSADLKAQRKALLEAIKAVHNPTADQLKKIESIMDRSSVMGQGNPATTKHPVTKEACLEQAKSKKIEYENKEFEKICGAKYMAPMYNASKEKPADAKACIDQFEFPNIPCEYPMVWTQANEAAEICEALGKRMCDAHEWEGACEGDLQDPDYDFALAKGVSANNGVERMRKAHNTRYAPKKTWAYGGNAYKKGICGADSTKAGDCNGGDWKRCGSNTYPSGYFPECKSKFAVYDQHGNAAEHMSIPLNESEMSSKGSKTLGHTEMKGSWFIFDKFNAHQDWCRWRAPYWHGTRVMDPKSHHNYHLGFRCCNTLSKK